MPLSEFGSGKVVAKLARDDWSKSCGFIAFASNMSFKKSPPRSPESTGEEALSPEALRNPSIALYNL